MKLVAIANTVDESLDSVDAAHSDLRNVVAEQKAELAELRAAIAEWRDADKGYGGEYLYSMFADHVNRRTRFLAAEEALREAFDSTRQE